jgi:hypothetical protein
MGNSQEKKPKLENFWNRTELVAARLDQMGQRELPSTESPYGRYGNRPIIGANMDHVIGGVYLGAKAREAIVVDDTGEKPADKDLLHYFQNTFLPELRRHLRAETKLTPEKILALVYETVLREMPYNELVAEALINHVTEGVKDRKIHLMNFISHHVGVCRHQSLFTAYLIEKLRKEPSLNGLLQGKISVERNAIALDDETAFAAHAWVRFTMPDGKIYIIDATQKHFGPLEKLLQKGTSWEYARPGEREAFAKMYQRTVRPTVAIDQKDIKNVIKKNSEER